jgi:type I restriction enzyme S subunit
MLRTRNSEKILLNQRVGKFICNEKDLNIDYLYFVLTSEKYQDLLFNTGAGSGQPNLSPEMILDIEIPCPEYNQQQVIAEVLSSLDDKIDLLHRQNKTLEAMAETLFRQWFVEEAEESWEEISLFDIADHLKESINPSKDGLKTFTHYSLPAFDEGKEPKTEIGKEILSNKYKVVSNSILISKLNPITPRVWALFGSIDEEVTICSTEFQVVKPKKFSHFGFIYYFLKSFQVTGELAGSASGTSGSHQRVTPNDIFNLNLLYPLESKIEKFNEVTQQSLKKLKDNKSQICTLIKLRDELLPKLMSGDEVRVKSEK